MYPNFKSTQETKKLKHMLTNEKSNSHLFIKNQTKINKEQDVTNIVIRQVCSLKTTCKIWYKT
jgi:hypothetical protein